MPSSILSACAVLLANHGLTIAFAESATAGRATAEFALTEESGQILKGGLVCYDASIKEEVLGIPKTFVEKYTPESAEVTREMARSLHKIVQADIYVAITGLTTSGGSESAKKPVGTMFIHVLFLGEDMAVRKVFEGNAENIMLQAIDVLAAIIIDGIKLREKQKEAN